MSIDAEIETRGRRHPADSHDVIRVQGARENNLRDVHLDIPKRRLTVFTGVSGSGKSSLVFGTIAAESQRMINETYSAFVQGFMPSLGRPDVDVLEGLTTAIIVDQERMGANVRSTVGTATDANAMLRILFSRLGDPHLGSPQAYSFNVASAHGAGAVTVERGGASKAVKATFSVLGGMCPRCEGMGNVTDIDLAQLYDESKSLTEGAITVPGYTADGWAVRIYSESGFVPADKPVRDFSATELNDFLHKEPTKIKVAGMNMTYEGLVPRVQKSFLAKDREAMQPHIRAFVDRAVTFTSCPECGGTRLNETARSSRIRGVSIADACAMQISDLAEWVRGLDEPSAAPLLEKLGHTLDSFVQIGLGYLSLDRPAGTLSGGEAQRTKMIRHLGSSLTDVTYVFDEPTVGLHPHDIERMNELLLQLRDNDRHRRPRRRHRAGGRNRRGDDLFRGDRRRVAGERHSDRSASGGPGGAQVHGAHAPWGAGDPGSHGEQSAGRRCRHPARRSHGDHGRGRIGKEFAHPRIRPRLGGRGLDRPERDQGIAQEQSRHVHGTPRAHPQGVRQGERGQTRALQRELRGRMSR
ncbi:MAG: daunorubicin resistance protein DrrC, partial [Microbacterium sp.]|nr:daunorubicin resistance protein DrrC [Microbacterium sp.]